MSSTFNLESFLPTPDNLTKAAYQIFQDAKSGFGLTHKQLSTRLRQFFFPEQSPKTRPLSSETLEMVRQKRAQLLAVDWQEAQEDIYPVSLLFDNPWEDFWRYYPAVWLDFTTQWQRIQEGKYQQFSPEIDLEGYPNYYLQNFHHQTDGYLSEMSANLYDLQVEILFNGMADAMRRRILKPLKAGLAALAFPLSQQMRVLDVACGTGRTLKMVRGALPKASLLGVDLSPAYLRKANQLLSEMPGELPQLVQANAENLPYLDNYCQAVTSVFLFHELPPEVRQRVIAECFRVLQPGGTFIICDSIQKGDAPEFDPMMENFPVIFHEPYYRSYITDDLNSRLLTAGFENIQTEIHFASKYWLARKPDS